MIGGLRWASPELLPGQSCCALAHSSSDQRASPSLCCPGTQSRAGSPSTGSWEHTKHRASITRGARGSTWHGRDGSCSHQRCPEPQCWLHHGQAQLCSLSGQHSQPRANRNWDWECWLTGLWHDLAIKKHKMLLLVWVFFPLLMWWIMAKPSVYRILKTSFHLAKAEYVFAAFHLLCGSGNLNLKKKKKKTT